MDSAVRYLFHSTGEACQEFREPREHGGRQLEDATVNDVVGDLMAMLLQQLLSQLLSPQFVLSGIALITPIAVTYPRTVNSGVHGDGNSHYHGSFMEIPWEWE